VSGYVTRKIAKKTRWRHLFLTLTLVLACSPIIASPQSHQPVDLTAQDIRELIAFYKTDDPSAAVEAFRRQMPPPVTDQSFRASVLHDLPTDLTKLTINDYKLAQAMRMVLKPVLSLYQRLAVYDILIIDSSTPLIMLDSGVVLVITTGMIKRATSDDMLIGYAAHEVGHEFFLKYSVYSKYLQRLVAERGNDPVVMRHLTEILVIIELQCDAFAALTLRSLGYNPLEFIEDIDRTNREFPRQKSEHHPPDAQRRAVVAGLFPTGTRAVQPRQSEAFRHLKALVAKHQSNKTARVGSL